VFLKHKVTRHGSTPLWASNRSADEALVFLKHKVSAGGAA